MIGRRHVTELIRRYFQRFRKSQWKTIRDLTMGLLRSRQIGQAAIARGMWDLTSVRHRIKRIWRFCQNERIRPIEAFGALAQWICARCSGTLVVALDWTDLGDYKMLAAKVVVCSRAVPLAWTVVRKGEFSEKMKSQNSIEERLIKTLQELLGQRAWLLIADRGFRRAALLRTLNRWGINYVIRASANTWVKTSRGSGLLGEVRPRPSRALRYRKVLYQKELQVETGLVVCHRRPADEPWYLVTNMDLKPTEAERIYRQRMWIEESFRDSKSNFGLDELWLSEPERMERMMIVLAVAMLLVVLRGLQYRQTHGARDPQLSTKKRGVVLSIFRIGLELIWLHGFPSGLDEVRFPVLVPDH